MKCPNCKKEIDEGNFCKYCGGKIKGYQKDSQNRWDLNSKGGKKTEIKNSGTKIRSNNSSYQKNRLFKLLFAGRIGRLRYFLYFLIIYALFLPAFILRDQVTLYNNGISIVNYIINLIFFLAIIPIVVKRFHDFGAPGYLASILFLIGLLDSVLGLNELTLLYFVFGLLLIFKKGDNGTNKYGEVRK